ncbi:MAG TPA: hypothetical protein VLW85_00350 [Myxococcales bacterium]|nr:hypothetical protein [Myxococcales bacterium]
MKAVVAALLVALPAQSRKHDERLRGDSPKLARASVAFIAPADLARIEFDVPVEVQLKVENYPMDAGAHVHLIVDNEPAMQVDDLSKPVALKLEAGPHLVRAVLCRPWHEVVKAPHAFAMSRFWIGPPLPGKAGRAAEFVAWPDPKKPILTYVLPLPQGRPTLDFYLANARLARRGDKLRVVLDRRELPLLTEWKPFPLRRARGGTHRITIDLLNRKGLKVKNAVNRTDRVFTVTR